MNTTRYKAAFLILLVAATAATVVCGAARGAPRGRRPASSPWADAQPDLFGRGPVFGGPGGFIGRGFVGLGGPGPGMLGGRGAMILHVLHRIDLTEDQKAAIKELLQNEEVQAARKAGAEAVAKAMKAVHEAAQAVAKGEEGASAEAVQKAAAALGEAMVAQAKRQAEMVAAVKALLNEDQRAKLGKIEEKAAAIRGKLSDPDVREALKMMHGMRSRGPGVPGGGFPGRGGFGRGRGGPSGMPGGPSGRMGPGGRGGEWAPWQCGFHERFGGRFGR